MVGVPEDLDEELEEPLEEAFPDGEPTDDDWTDLWDQQYGLHDGPHEEEDVASAPEKLPLAEPQEERPPEPETPPLMKAGHMWVVRPPPPKRARLE